ncbi:MAG: calcium/sodium antiporter [Vicinamibacterales bacterium]
MSVLLIVAGLALLAAGGELLLRGAVGLAARLQLSPAVIGLTVVAAGTSVPELAVSVLAALEERTDLAVGNVVGSNLFNLLAILGASAVLRPLAIGGSTIRLEYPVLVLVTLMCLALTQDGTVNRLDAALLLTVHVAFTAYMVSLVRSRMTVHEVQEFDAEVRDRAHAGPADSLTRLLLLVAGGAVLLGSGAQATVTGAVAVATWFGLSERVIGLTIVSVGTSLPEIVTSLVSVARGRDDVAIGNVIGSNLFNILVILGLSAAISPLTVNASILASDNWWMLGATLGIFPLMVSRNRIGRLEGALLLATYGVYLAGLLTAPAAR